MKRMGMMIRLRPEHVAEYKRLHREVWPEVLRMIEACNITNYTIFFREPENLLFGYWEYRGTDFDADMAKMAADPDTQRWWAICKPQQQPLDSVGDGEWWAMMEEVFHHD